MGESATGNLRSLLQGSIFESRRPELVKPCVVQQGLNVLSESYKHSPNIEHELASIRLLVQLGEPRNCRGL